MVKDMALTAKERKFCEEFIKGYKQVDAYMAAFEGCSRNTAYSNSYKIMKKPEVREYITELEKDAFEAKRITAEHIANELASMAFGEVGGNLSMTNKLRALELLQKQLGVQIQNVKADLETNININIVDD